MSSAPTHLGTELIVVTYSFGLTMMATIVITLGRLLLRRIAAIDASSRRNERRARRHRTRQDRALRESVRALRTMTRRSAQDGDRLDKLERGHGTLRDAVSGLTVEVEALGEQLRRVQRDTPH